MRQADTPSVNQLAVELAQVRRRVKILSRKPQLTHSAIDDGALVTTVDGQLTSIVGKQYDGTSGSFTVAGPIPPTPVAPTMNTRVGGVQISVSGEFQQNPTLDRPVVAPMDFSRFEVEVCDDPSFIGEITRVGVTSAAGGDVTIGWAPTGTPLYARVRARSLSGKISLPSLTAGPVSSGSIGIGDLGFDLEEFTGSSRISYGTTTPTAPQVGELWMKETGTSTGAAGQPSTGSTLYETRRWNGTTWALQTAQGVTAALRQALAAEAASSAGAAYYAQAAPPTHAGAADSAIWTDTDDQNVSYRWTGSAWAKRVLGNGSITTRSLIAFNVLATGTVTASLFEALLVLATTLVAGNPNGNHARLNPSGLRVYRANQTGGTVPDEVIRLATDTNDFFGIVDAGGNLVGSWDDTGRLMARAGAFEEDVFIGGRSVTDMIGATGGSAGRYKTALVGNVSGAGYGWFGKALPTGIIEANGYLQAGYTYPIHWQATWTNASAGDEMTFAIHASAATTTGAATAPAPTAVSTPVESWVGAMASSGKWRTTGGRTTYTAAITGRHRFLLSGQAGGGNVSDTLVIGDSRFPVTVDIGTGSPAVPNAGQISQGGVAFAGQAPPPPPPNPPQQYNTGWMEPAGWRAFRGDGVERFDVSGPVQGWDPNGTGDGFGFWWWTLPDITGSVDEVWVWLYASHWHNSGGGTAILNIIPTNTHGDLESKKLSADVYISEWPKPGSRQVDIGLFRGHFHSNQGAARAIGVSVGNAGNTNLQFQGRFDGPSARLGIRYTQ